MKKQTLKQKDFDSFCLKHIQEANKVGVCKFTPTRGVDNLLVVHTRIVELVETKYPNLLVTLLDNTITIIKHKKPSTPPQKKAGPVKTKFQNTIFEPLNKTSR